MRPLWRETSTRPQNAGLKNESHRPHVRMRMRGPNVDLRTSLRPPQLAALFHFSSSIDWRFAPKETAPARGRAEAVKVRASCAGDRHEH
jgi:hypothetical protein